MATRLSNTVTCTIDITQLGRQFEQGIVNTMRTIANNVLTELVVRTPIDTGMAKSNWQVGINQPPTGVIPSRAPGTFGSTFNAVNSYTISAGQQVIGTLNSPSDRIYITNSLPYINKLNDGWSLQAPQGFVENAIVRGIRSVAGTRIIP
jgi:hypothetical protein